MEEKLLEYLCALTPAKEAITVLQSKSPSLNYNTIQVSDVPSLVTQTISDLPDENFYAMCANDKFTCISTDNKIIVVTSQGITNLTSQNSSVQQMDLRGSLLAVIYADNLAIWDILANRVKFQTFGNFRTPTWIDNLNVAVSEGDVVQIFCVKTQGSKKFQLAAPVLDLAFLGKGRFSAALENGSIVTIGIPNNGQQIGSINFEAQQIFAGIDDRLIAVNNSRISVLNFTNGTVIQTLNINTNNPITCLQCAPGIAVIHETNTPRILLLHATKSFAQVQEILLPGIENNLLATSALSKTNAHMMVINEKRLQRVDIEIRKPPETAHEEPPEVQLVAPEPSRTELDLWQRLEVIDSYLEHKIGQQISAQMESLDAEVKKTQKKIQNAISETVSESFESVVIPRINSTMDEFCSTMTTTYSENIYIMHDMHETLANESNVVHSSLKSIVQNFIDIGKKMTKIATSKQRRSRRQELLEEEALELLKHENFQDAIKLCLPYSSSLMKILYQFDPVGLVDHSGVDEELFRDLLEKLATVEIPRDFEELIVELAEKVNLEKGDSLFAKKILDNADKNWHVVEDEVLQNFHKIILSKI